MKERNNMPESQQPEKGIQIVLEDILKNPNNRILDVGAGTGKWGKLLYGKVSLINAVEVWEPNIYQYLLKDYYDNVYCANIIGFDIQNGTYDSVILGDVLEHLPYEDAINLIKYLKKVVKKIYLVIPINVCIQDGNRLGNPYETHLYHWSDKEIRALFGMTLLNIGVNDNGLVAIGTYIWQS